MKLTKAQNPYDVQVGQVRKFTIVRLDKYNSGCFAVAQYSGRDRSVIFETKINLLSFDRYTKVK
jgi:hypothetical protein